MDVVSDNEGQRTTPPAEMVRSGKYVIPTINGNDYLAKPPLLYWAVAGVYQVTGVVSPFTARIPTALCYVALVMCVFGWVRRYAGTNTAFWSAIAVLSAPYVLQRSRVTELDIPLTLATFLAIIAFHSACQPRGAARTLLMVFLGGIALGAATMLKGPVPYLFLFPAYLAMLATDDTQDVEWMRGGIRLTIGMMALGLVLWVLSLVPFVAQFLRFPIALMLMVGCWTVIAWRRGHPQQGRLTLVFLSTILVGFAVTAPWGIAVLHTKGWDFVTRLIQSESLERTHTATAINSGSPLYYLIALPFMMAPWGFLLPLHFAKRLWLKGNVHYRFCVLAGWLSVFLFSLIAGKEYEYVLPAVPLLLVATGYHLAKVPEQLGTAWATDWTLTWRKAMIALFLVGGVGTFLYILVKQHVLILVIESLVLAAVTVWLGRTGWRNEARRLYAIAGMALCVVLMVLLSQSFYYTGKRSFKDIATATGQLLNAGYDVEAVKMTTAFDIFPGFAFYAGTVVPTVTDPEHIKQRLEGDKPYYCVLREKAITESGMILPEQFRTPLMGPFTRKAVVMIGNRPLPDLKVER